MKKLLSIILSAVMLLVSVPAIADADSEIKVFADGKQLEFDVQPIIENDRTLVPMRAIFEALGAEVSWDEEKQLIIAVKKTSENTQTNIEITIGESVMKKSTMKSTDISDTEDTVVALDVPARIVNDRTLIPLRAVSEAFDCDVQWDGEARTVTVTSAKRESKSNSYEMKLLSYMPDDENYMISPFFLKMTLAIAANGASGQTKDEILKSVDIKDIDSYNEYSKTLVEYVKTANSINRESVDGRERPIFEIANSIWINKDYKDGIFDGVKFTDEYSKIVADYYDGVSMIVDKSNKAEEMNSWVKEKTHEKIESIIDDEGTDFLAAAVNAVYMKAQWMDVFDPNKTEKGEFTDRNGKKTEIDLMNNTEYYNYYADDEIQFVEIPYYGGLSMFVALGDASKFKTVKDKGESTYVALAIPKFKTTCAINLNDILSDMGIKLAFDKESAVFDKMLVPKPEMLWLDKVLQKTYISVDENGTEAAAVTFAGMGAATSMPVYPTPVEFKADKPFTYFICDEETGQIFFMGEYAFAE
ncbi:MAG: serpin family protein [Clostridia bacterium]